LNTTIFDLRLVILLYYSLVIRPTPTNAKMKVIELLFYYSLWPWWTL